MIVRVRRGLSIYFISALGGVDTRRSGSCNRLHGEVFSQFFSFLTIQVFSSDLIASYCDMLMKNSAEKMGDNELDEILDQVVALFRYINDKDLFQEFYRYGFLCVFFPSICTKPRLPYVLTLSFICLQEATLEASVDADRERRRRKKSDQQAQDVPRCAVHKPPREDAHRQEPLAGAADALQAVPLGAWGQLWVRIHDAGAHHGVVASLPPAPLGGADVRAERNGKVQGVLQLSDKGMCFLCFSLTSLSSQSRKLRWVHSLANVTLDALFNKQKFQLQVTAFQACVLLLFNDKELLSGEMIVKELTLPWEEAKKALQSLAMGKYKLLIKVVPEGVKAVKTVDEKDQFKVNVAFTDKSRKLKIPTVVAKTNLKVTAQVCSPLLALFSPLFAR